MKNGYCGVVSKVDGLYLYVVPAVDGGKAVSFDDVDEYLTKLKVPYNRDSVVSFIMSITERKELKISDLPRNNPDNEAVVVKVESDRMFVKGKFYPPTMGGGLLSREDIVAVLIANGVKFGVCDDEIDKFLTEREYCKEYMLAKALAPEEGKNAVITYYFNTDTNKKPQTNDDGSVDFHKLDNISHIRKDDLLASLDPAVDGKPGLDVAGAVIRQQKVIRKVLKHGNKVRMSEDGLKMYSEVDGHVSLVDDKVFVSDNYEVATDVGPSTGDIEYDGNITVKGNVVSGYTVRARGDIIVEGVVEAATLFAMGQIILKRGIQGGTKGKLHADGNIVSKFIENAEVYSGGYIQTESIMHSNIMCRGDVIVGGKKGFITGGEIHSGSMISAKMAGNTMGTRTLLEVGIDPAVIDEYRELEKNIPAMTEESEKINQLLLAYAKKIKAGEKFDARVVLSIKDSSARKKQLDEDIETNKERYAKLQKDIENSDGGTVKIMDIIYPGCRIIISNVSYFIKNEIQHSRFIRDKADIKIMML